MSVNYGLECAGNRGVEEGNSLTYPWKVWGKGESQRFAVRSPRSKPGLPECEASVLIA